MISLDASKSLPLKVGNRQQATGNRQQATGNRQQAIGKSFISFLLIKMCKLNAF
jgi:hypothetical protein